MGLSPLSAGYRTLRASNEILTAEAALLESRGAIGFVSSSGKRAMTAEEAKKAESALNKRWGGATNMNKVGVTSGDMKFVSIGMSPSDLKILESGIVKLRDLCSLFNVPSRMFNDPEGTTYNNAKEDFKRFYLDAVIPALEIQIKKFNRDYSKGWSLDEGKKMWIEMDTSEIEVLQEDQSKAIVKAKTRSLIIRETIKGIGIDWTQESAVMQLMDSLGMNEEDARKIIDVEIKNTSNE